jgi:cation diffusion facilitator CzcD-associated flavoprotein CzcO
MSERLPVCVIGAGPSGIAAAKALHQRGVPYLCFEKGGRVGGLWARHDSSGRSPAYRNLRVNTSRRRTAFSDFPMPATYPDYPHHTHMATYLDAYVDHFGCREHIRFNTEVERAIPADGGTWSVALSGGETLTAGALVVANGHHWDPNRPEPPPGSFDGTIMHARDYDDNGAFCGRHVVVVGGADTAADIAVEISYVAASTCLSMRRGAHVIPRYLFGKPVDFLPPSPYLPWRIKQALRQGVLRLAVGRVEDFGLPRPRHGLMQAHPTVSDYLLPRVAEGAITVKPALDRLLGDRVRFADGSEERADVIIYCTGYKISFPFFDPSLISAPQNEFSFFKYVFHPEIPNLAFAGLIQPSGALIPVAEQQAAWVAEQISGAYVLPTPAEMRADIARERARRLRRYVPSPRHSLEVDGEVYLREIRRERTRGVERARRGYGP